MHKSRPLKLSLVVLAVIPGFAPIKTESLFNGKNLNGWDVYIGPLYDSIKKDFVGEPIGLNRDPHHVFSVVNKDGEPAIRVSGENYGGLSTTQEFSNYHLRLEFKWGQLKWIPKRNSKRDSGLLYHAVGPHAADWFFWMRSQEFQIQEGDCGDYWGCGGAFANIPAMQFGENKFMYSPGGTMLQFRDKSPSGRNCIKSSDAEKPTGEWNTIDLYCFEDTSVHMVNGKVVMILYKLREPQATGDKALTKGKIQLQSEGAEVFYRNIVVEKITSIPDKFLK